jgi:DNA-binding transcriptional MerR regulator
MTPHKRAPTRLNGTLSRSFASGEVVTLTGVSFRTLDHWARTGFIVPSIDPGTGTGSNRLYSFRDVTKVRAAVELRSLGVATARIKQILAADTGTLETERACIHVDLLGISGDLIKQIVGSK